MLIERIAAKIKFQEIENAKRSRDKKHLYEEYISSTGKLSFTGSQFRNRFDFTGKIKVIIDKLKKSNKSITATAINNILKKENEEAVKIELHFLPKEEYDEQFNLDIDYITEQIFNV